MRHKYSEDQDRFLIDNVKGITLEELRDKFNKQFNLNLSKSAIANRKNKLHLSSGITGGQFQKGNIPANKGKKWDEYMSKEGQENSRKTTFKKGNVPQNYRPVGSERITKDGYVEIKVADPNKWELKHRCVYKQHFGEIPEGYNIMFADQNKQNLDINNLILVSKSEDLIMNNNKLIGNNGELTKSGLLIAKVISKRAELKRR